MSNQIRTNPIAFETSLVFKGEVLCGKDNEIIQETWGSNGPDATVFQAEYIIEGLDMLQHRLGEIDSLLIRTDNQAVAKSL